MEQRVRDIIESLQKFDPNLRVSEKTTLNFKYDGEKTRLAVECNDVDLISDNQRLLLEVQSLEQEVERLEGEMDDQVKIINDLEAKASDLEDDLKGCRQSLDVIRGGL